MTYSSQSESDKRVVRVFISSTFKDMQEERDILIKNIFPQLRKMCEKRTVTWTEVDLRWGITDEQKAEGSVLPLCLEEIHRCRPYFIGLLGERYGWVPDAIPKELLESQNWLKQHFQHSVTELEILHGVLNHQDMYGHAYFYFRNPKYLESIAPERLQDFTSESAEKTAKLQKLKHRIRLACDERICELREDYLNPEQVGEWILEDFTKLIDRLYPKDQTPDLLDQEAARHQAYAQNRRLAFVGRDDLLHRIDEHFSSGVKPLVLTGESGCGKSAVLAEWAARWHKDHPVDLIIQHFIGSTPDSADWQGIVRRILGVLKRAFQITDEVPVQPDALRVALHEWTGKAASSRRVVLVLDALSQLADENTARQLGWLPVIFPPNFCVLVSSLPGESLDVIRKRGWPDLTIPLFVQADITPVTLAYFRVFSKIPPPDILAKLEGTPAACNPLYLRTVLDELRQFGKHEELHSKAAQYLAASDLPELFDRILNRWHDDFGTNPEHLDIVHRSLCLVACARFGLSEAELRDLLGRKNAKGEDEPLARWCWTPFYLAAENALALRSGLIAFGHDYLRSAVWKRWLQDGETVRSFRMELVDYFSMMTEPTERKLAELPWLQNMAGNLVELLHVLVDLKMARALIRRSTPEVAGYWKAVCSLSEPVTAYRGVWNEWQNTGATDEELALTHEAVGDMLVALGNITEAQNHYSVAIIHRSRLHSGQQASPKPDTSWAEAWITLARNHRIHAKYQKAEQALLNATSQAHELVDQYPDDISALSVLVRCHQEAGSLYLCWLNPDKALQYSCLAFETTKIFASRLPGDRSAALLLACCYRLLGDTRCARGEHRSALLQYTQAMQTVEGIRGWNEDELLIEEASVLNQKIGQENMAIGEIPLALSNFQLAVDFSQRLLRYDPNNLQSRYQLCQAQRQFAGALLGSDSNLPNAIALLEPALATARELADLDQNNVSCQFLLAECLCTLAEVHRQEGHLQQSRSDLVEARSIIERQHLTNPQSELLLKKIVAAFLRQ